MLTIIRFGLIGILNTAIDFGVLNLLIVLFGLPIDDYPRYALFKGISFIIAVTNSYFLNKYWVFKQETRTNANQISKFLVINLISLGINTLIGSFVFSISSAHPALSAHAWANVAALCGVIVTFIFNFFAYKFIVFKPS
jgi:putative flippase GtrA